MSLDAGSHQLSNGFKTLQVQWDQSRLYWRDAVRDDFERHYWNVLAARVPAALDGMSQLDQILSQIRRECGEDTAL